MPHALCRCRPPAGVSLPVGALSPPRYGSAMSEHRATIEWAGGAKPEDFLKLRYTREHRWSFDGGATVEASASPSVVPAPWSNPRSVDPEEAYVASISICLMLAFQFAARN